MAIKKSYVIPLRRTFQKAAPTKRGPKAVRAVRTYLKKHCKVEEVKLGSKLNDTIWARGITNPPARVSVDVVIEDGIAKAELQGHKYVEAKKVEKKTEPETIKEKLAQKIAPKAAKKETVEEETPAEEETKTAKQPTTTEDNKAAETPKKEENKKEQETAEKKEA